MKSRRSFFRNASKLAVGITVAPMVLFANENSNALSHDIAPKNQLDLRTHLGIKRHITIQGKVFDKSGMLPKANARIKVLMTDIPKYQLESCSEVITNRDGEYLFTLDFPKKVKGKAPRVNFNVSYEDNDYTTELIVGNSDAYITGEHWELNHQLGDNLFPKKEDFSNYSVVSFNLAI